MEIANKDKFEIKVQKAVAYANFRDFFRNKSTFVYLSGLFVLSGCDTLFTPPQKVLCDRYPQQCAALGDSAWCQNHKHEVLTRFAEAQQDVAQPKLARRQFRELQALRELEQCLSQELRNNSLQLNSKQDISASLSHTRQWLAKREQSSALSTQAPLLFYRWRYLQDRDAAAMLVNTLRAKTKLDSFEQSMLGQLYVFQRQDEQALVALHHALQQPPRDKKTLAEIFATLHVIYAGHEKWLQSYQWGYLANQYGAGLNLSLIREQLKKQQIYQHSAEEAAETLLAQILEGEYHAPL